MYTFQPKNIFSHHPSSCTTSLYSHHRRRRTSSINHEHNLESWYDMCMSLIHSWALSPAGPRPDYRTEDEYQQWSWAMALLWTWEDATRAIMKQGFITERQYRQWHLDAVNRSSKFRHETKSQQDLMHCLTLCRVRLLEDEWHHYLHISRSICIPRMKNEKNVNPTHMYSSSFSNLDSNQEEPSIECVFMEDPYQLLESCHIHSLADFRRWALKHHPDRGGSTEWFQRVNNAMTLVFDR